MTNLDALLESAITSLQENGYAGTTARDIAAGAGVSLGAIGYHFGTVQKLLDAALAEAVRRWFAPMIGLLSRPQPPPTLEQLGPALDGLLDTFAGHRPLVIAYFEALLRAERSPALHTALAADLDALRQALTGGIQRILAREPESASPDPQAAASLIMATFDGLIIQWLLSPEQVPSGQLITDTLRRTAALATQATPNRPTPSDRARAVDDRAAENPKDLSCNEGRHHLQNARHPLLGVYTLTASGRVDQQSQGKPNGLPDSRKRGRLSRRQPELEGFWIRLVGEGRAPPRCRRLPVIGTPGRPR